MKRSNLKRIFSCLLISAVCVVASCGNASSGSGRQSGGDDTGKQTTVVVETANGSFIYLSARSIDVYIGDTYVLTPVTYPAGVNVEWQSSDPTIAEVNGGTIRALKAGKARITASMSDADKVYCDVNVVAGSSSVYSMKLSRELLRLNSDENFTLSAAVRYGSDVVNGADVQWKSSDVEVATVDADGTVHPVGFGGAIISAECITADGSYLTASCEVKVIGSYYISLNGDEGAIEVSPKETFNFTPTVRDYDGVLVAASEDEFTYGSLNQDIVAYENGKFVAKAIGETVVYAEYKGAVGLKTVTVGTLKAEDFTVISGIGDTGVTVGADGYWVYKGVSGVDFDNACGVMGEKWRQFVSAAKASGFGKITVTVYEIKGLLKFRPYNTDSGLLGTANKVLRSTDCSYEQPYVTEINVSDCEDWSGAYLGMDKDGEFVFLITLE